MSERIAIIGGGIAGLTAAHLLAGKYDVTLFEKDGRLGGNAYTLETREGETADVSVFAFNGVSYPNFFRLLSELGIEAARFGFSGVAATSYDLDAQRACYLAPFTLRGLAPGRLRTTWRSLAGMKRAIRLLGEGRLEGLTLGEAMKLVPGLTGDAYLHLIFALCLASSMHYDEVVAAPATFFVEKLRDHLATGPTTFRQVPGRTRGYVEALARSIGGGVVLNAEIRRVSRNEAGIALEMADGRRQAFDKLVFACNADQALALLEDPTTSERRLLGAWRYKDGLVVVHRDDTCFPPPRQRALYAYLYTSRKGRIETSINACYRFQPGVSKTSDLLGTQHPNFPIRGDRIEFQKVFRTPIFDAESVRSIPELPTLNGERGTFYCGSHFGHGLHEDAVASAAAVARRLGVRW